MKKARVLVAKLDRLWALKTKELWRSKYGAVCVWCKSRPWSQSDHIVNRWKFSTRWDLRNCVCLCSECHLFQKKMRPLEWKEMVYNVIGTDTLQALVLKGNNSEKIDLKTIERNLKNGVVG